ncbi:MAG: hypothetical protein II032_02685 [Treponema sp.]|nr:hypothetical protein [Treponema sp.]
MKLSKKAAFVLGAFLLSTPMIFADSKLNKEIASLELELTKMNTKIGEYADMSEAKLTKLKEKTKKTLNKKKAAAKKELEKDTKKAKKNLKEAGNSIKDAGKEVGKTVSNFFD